MNASAAFLTVAHLRESANDDVIPAAEADGKFHATRDETEIRLASQLVYWRTNMRLMPTRTDAHQQPPRAEQ